MSGAGVAETAPLVRPIEPDSAPLTVTIVIPAYERAEALAGTLAAIGPAISAEVEVLVVDDCSTSGEVAAACAGHEGRIRYVRTPTNSGVVGARNHGYGLAGGDIIVSLDDDSHPASLEVLRRSVEAFGRNPKLGVIAYNIETPAGLEVLPDTPPFRCYTYTGCGNAIRRSAMIEAGPLDRHFWRQGEEIEHSLRIYDAGYEVVTYPELIVVHEESPINRDGRAHNSHFAANYLKRVAMRNPWHALPAGVAGWLGHLVRHRRTLSLRLVLRELARRDRGLLAALRDRRPISAATYREVRNIKRIEKLVRQRNAA